MNQKKVFILGIIMIIIVFHGTFRDLENHMNSNALIIAEMKSSFFTRDG